MIYTKEQLKEISDHEINLAVAKKINFKRFIFPIFGEAELKEIGYKKCVEQGHFSPCENWGDIMPISEKYGINIRWILETNHIAVGGFEVYSEENINGASTDYRFCENPKRAICEVFLMMDID